MSSYHVMADPAQLRKCEELLGKLPQKPPARVHNPMWAFLKGIEGFNTERASECLVKLFDEHYDTIEVLKLATKQDLMEDAGILPGDALRIVAAAKHYVAPQEANHSAGFGVSEPPPQSDAREHGVVGDADLLQSVEHHQHAYRPPMLRESTPVKTVVFTPATTSQAQPHEYSQPVMEEQKKARTVAQEVWKIKEQNAVYVAAPSVKVVNESAVLKQEVAKESKLVEQAAPKHIKDVIKDSKVPEQTFPIPIDIKDVIKDSKVPEQTFPIPINIKDVIKDSKVPEQTFPIPIDIKYPHTCRICNVQCISEINCHMHYNGQKHRAKSAGVLKPVKEATQPAQDPKAAMKKTAETQPTQSLLLHTCGVCNVKCTSEVDLRSHFNGRQHIQKLEAATDSNDNSPTTFLYCSICNINSGCKRNLVMHLKGKKHAQNMKVESESGDSSYYSDSDY